jgi:membrane protease YdiL (CAAX protease family)
MARPASEWDDLWRPSCWRRQPSWPRTPGIQLAAILALVLYANVIVNEVLAPPWYVPFNLSLLAIALLIARSSHTSWVSMGMRRDRLARGARIGLILGAAVVLAIGFAALVPTAREAFRDDRIVEGSIALSMYHALFRVPLGTAVYEEVLFRGIIFGLLARRTSPLAAAMWSSLVFGIWHVLPALDAIEVNPIGDAIGGTWVPVIGAVLSTFIVGLCFVWIRLYAGSILAPILVHIAANSTAIMAAAFVVYVL